jgi:transposase
VFKAYMLKESLESLWNYRYEGAMVNYLRRWMDQLRWQRLPPFQKLSLTLAKHVDGILNFCRTKVRFGVVETVNGDIRMLINRGRDLNPARQLHSAMTDLQRRQLVERKLRKGPRTAADGL